MDINKAIKKQKKSYFMFVFLMSFIFLTLPLVLFLSRVSNIILIVYLVFNEIFIFITAYVVINSQYLKFFYYRNKIKLKLGIFSEKITIGCDKVSIIHVENCISKETRKKDFDIILISSSNFRSRKLVKVDEIFLNKYPEILAEYRRLNKLYPEVCFYYINITRGRILKYKLLDTIYKGCMQTIYTEKAMEKIKEFRNE